MRGCLPSPPLREKFPLPMTCGGFWRGNCAGGGWKRAGRRSGWRWSAGWTAPMSRRWSARSGTCRYPTSKSWPWRWGRSPGNCFSRPRAKAKARRADSGAVSGLFPCPGSAGLSTVCFGFDSAQRSIHGRCGRFASLISKILYPNTSGSGVARAGGFGGAGIAALPRLDGRLLLFVLALFRARRGVVIHSLLWF